MKVLVVTGRLAEGIVRRAVSRFENVDVLVLDVDVAAFITPEMLMDAEIPKNYDLILIPGLISRRFDEAEEKIGIPIRLGPKSASDLDLVMERIDDIELSKEIPACELIRDVMRERALREVEEMEMEAECTFEVGGIKIGGNSRMKVMVEIEPASEVKVDADIFDLGFSPHDPPEFVERCVEECTHHPICANVSNEAQLLAALNAGAEIVSPVNSEIIRRVGNEIAENDAACIVIPDKGIESLLSNIRRCREIGIEKIIADPIIRPPCAGSLKSIVECYEFRRIDGDTPLFFGAGNITESVDADSIGMNAILSLIASELNASIIFTPERSDKTRGSSRELMIASKMMFLAKRRGKDPKDLGIDLLVVKEKRKRDAVKFKPKEIIEAHEAKYCKHDPAGFFRIWIDDGKIYALHSSGRAIVGNSAREVIDTIISLGLVSKVEHAAYLGRELERAEIAMKLGRSFVQSGEF